ncbi:MAG: coproporphyrinogen III oxidase [Maricaulis sp.]|jgi:oxygen-independent coproporphyrinogen-3 oxidase|nr:coproporphyrinogen III oxidase [Maricaulis sp.]HAQ35026.1 coproporphyrinogen III oxidase [Alphaproteobacteria bacterium]
MSATRAPLGLYIHWPYCRRICPYCDFNVYRARAYDTDLTDALIADLSGWAELAGARPLTSIHFGGGTPSLMSAPDVERVIDAAHRVFGLKSGAEIGLEANPAEADALPDLARAGINRMSVGVQSLRDDALKRLGRDHDAAKAAEAVRVAQKVVPRVSVDLIHTREGQSLADWEMELTEAIALGTGHVSAYQLTLEPGTAFARQAETGRLELPDGDAAADFQELTDQTLAAAGFTAYEISNHARTRQDRSVHNSLYWTGGDWIGIGPGAHSRLGCALDGGRLAAEARAKPGAYVSAVRETGRGSEAEVRLTAPEEFAERVLMGLRISEGIDRAALEDATGLALNSARIASLAQDRWINVTPRHVALTPQGRLLADRIGGELAEPG